MDEETSGKSGKKKQILNSFSDDDNTDNELDPIRTDFTDSVFEKESEEAIVKNNLNVNNN